MINIIGVRFKKMGKLYYFDPCGKDVRAGEHVIVETSRGEEFGDCALGNTDIEDSAIVQPLKRLVRVATRADEEIMEENARHAKEAFEICRKKISEHGLDMHLVTVECTFDLNKILFYFTADGRVDFRDLVKDLAGIFRTRIELRQIGVRDEAKMLGGLGACGRELCCSSYLEDFQPVSINMAKEQNLSLNPTKISGTCGRLMCCLKYEHEVYSELQKITPKQGSYVETPEGNGFVVAVQMLRGLCRVQLEDSAEAPKTYACSEVRVLRAARGRGKPGSSPRDREDKPAADGKTDDRPARAPRSRTPSGERRENTRPQREERPEPAQPIAESVAEAEGDSHGEDTPRRRSRRGGRRRRKRPEGEGQFTATDGAED